MMVLLYCYKIGRFANYLTSSIYLRGLRYQYFDLHKVSYTNNCLRCNKRFNSNCNNSNKDHEGNNYNHGISIGLLVLVSSISSLYIYVRRRYIVNDFIFHKHNTMTTPFRHKIVASFDNVLSLLMSGDVSSIDILPSCGVAIVNVNPGVFLEGKVVDPDTVVICFYSHLYFARSATSFIDVIRQVERRLKIDVSDGISINVCHPSNTFSIHTVDLLFVAVLLGLTSFVKFGRSTPYIQQQQRSAAGNPGTGSQFMNMMDPFTSMTGQGNLLQKKPVAGGIMFKDVAGLKEAKQEVIEFVEYLKSPQKFQTLGAKLPRGALLLGPPGCGKTLLVKALANEADVPFYYMAGSEFVQVVSGVGAQRVRKLFSEAKKSAPAIIFIDEIDTIGRVRSDLSQSAGGGEMDQTLNQLLVEMDGIDSSKGVICFAATNRHKVLDRALVRPGRFDRHILVDLPTLDERKELFQLYLSKNKLSTDVSFYINRLASLTPGMSGADIANICNEAALTAAREGKNAVELDDFDVAMDRIMRGAIKKSRVLTDAERERSAYHQAGQLLVAWMLETTDPIVKASIVPRTNDVLSSNQRLTQERKLYTKQFFMEHMSTLLAGRLSESLRFAYLSDASQRDQESATKIAYKMVRQLGMSDRVGHISFDTTNEEDAYSRPYSDKLQRLMDMEVQRLLYDAQEIAQKLVEDNKIALEKLARLLLDQEEISFTEIVGVLGAPPFKKNIENMLHKL